MPDHTPKLVLYNVALAKGVDVRWVGVRPHPGLAAFGPDYFRNGVIEGEDVPMFQNIILRATGASVDDHAARQPELIAGYGARLRSLVGPKSRHGRGTLLPRWTYCTRSHGSTPPWTT